jgi:hypothetical protein
MEKNQDTSASLEAEAEGSQVLIRQGKVSHTLSKKKVKNKRSGDMPQEEEACMRPWVQFPVVRKKEDIIHLVICF